MNIWLGCTIRGAKKSVSTLSSSSYVTHSVASRVRKIIKLFYINTLAANQKGRLCRQLLGNNNLYIKLYITCAYITGELAISKYPTTGLLLDFPPCPCPGMSCARSVSYWGIMARKFGGASSPMNQPRSRTASRISYGWCLTREPGLLTSQQLNES